MKAILVTFSITTRLIVNDDFDEDELREEDYETLRNEAVPRIIDSIHINGIGDSLDDLQLDEECPYNEDDK